MGNGLPAVRADLPPGPTHLPYLRLFDYVWRPLPFLEDAQRRYGDPFTIRLGAMPPVVIMSDPGAVREVFTGDPELLRSGEANAALAAGLGRHSVLLLDGAEHLRERKLMLPPFHGERMRVYGDLIASVAERRIADWPAGRPFAVAPSMRAIALEVIMRAVFGMDDAERLERVRRALVRFIDTAAPPRRLLMLLLLKPGGTAVRAWQRVAPTLKRVDAILLEEIARRRADPASAERTDILSMLVQARDDRGEPLSDEHLRDELVTLLAAGHDTTATGLAWAIERLAREPAAVERLRTELEAGDEDYLDATIKETLRLRPVVPFVFRHLAAPMTIGGRDYPAGVRVAPCTHLVHRRPDLYPEPHAFRPERFLGPAPSGYTWFPFGGGTRRCLGAAFATFEMRTVLRTLLRAGVVSAPDPAPERVGRRGITLVPAQGARVVWHPVA